LVGLGAFAASVRIYFLALPDLPQQRLSASVFAAILSYKFYTFAGHLKKSAFNPLKASEHSWFKAMFFKFGLI